MMNLTIYSIVSYITIIIYKLGLNGFLIAYSIKVISEFSMLLYCAYRFNTISKPKFSI